MLAPAAKIVHVLQLATTHQVVNTSVVSAPKTPASVGSSLGISTQEAQHRLAYLVDEGLVARPTGDPNTATYMAL